MNLNRANYFQTADEIGIYTVITVTQIKPTNDVAKLVGLGRAERAKIRLARFNECMSSWAEC